MHFYRHLSTLLVALFLLSCSSGEQPAMQTVIDGFAQGGTYHIVIVDDKPQDHLKPAMDSMLNRIDFSMSLYNPESLLSRINRSETDSVDDFIKYCIEEAERLSRESDGRYDITIKPLTTAYGFGASEAVRRPNVDSLMQLIGYDKIRVEGNRLVKDHPDIQLDLNSIAQGATSDYIGQWLDSLGFENYLVEVGGEIYCRGLNARGRAWTVGIDKPVDGNFIAGAVLQVKIGISNAGLATSGNYRKFYTDEDGRKIVHTVDARTGEPVISNLLSATVVAENSTLADAYGTLLMIMGVDESRTFLEQRPDLQAYLVYSGDNGEYLVYMTPGMRSMIIEN